MEIRIYDTVAEKMVGEMKYSDGRHALNTADYLNHKGQYNSRYVVVTKDDTCIKFYSEDEVKDLLSSKRRKEQAYARQRELNESTNRRQDQSEDFFGDNPLPLDSPWLGMY